MEAKEKKFLLETTRLAIKHFLEKGERLEIKPEEIDSKELTEDGACFVTLYKDDKLRGCIGSLEAKQPLVFDVVENAINAAFRDPRFYPVDKEELEEVKISISVLTKPVPLSVSGPEELLQKLVVGKHGLILEQGIHRSTFLPIVWKQIPEKEEFLMHLSMKAGLPPDGWKDPKTKFLVYETIEFSE